MPLLHIPVTVDFGADGNPALDKFVSDNVEALIQSHRMLHETKISQWRDWYYGVPREETRSFPWDNAANLIVQLIGTHVDMLKARIMSTIYEVSPLVVAGLIGEWDEKEQGEEQREALEEFLNYVGAEPRELDLYRVEGALFTDAIRFGTGIAKHPWETDIECEVVSVDGSKVEREYTKYDGPRPEKIPLESFAVSPTANTLESADFKYHKRTLTRYQLEERASRGLYDKKLVNTILAQPDRSGASKVTKEDLAHVQIQSSSGYDQAEWDLYECWFPYFRNGFKYRLIYTYHRATKTRLKAVFNFYPDNMEVFKAARLCWDGDGFYGFGFCEMLHHYQEELSTVHNQDIDNATLSNTSVIRLDPSLKLDSQFSIYPMATLPFREGEVEVFQLGRAGADSIQRQRLTLEMAQERSGVEAGNAGNGGGVTNPKKGVYSAQGTFAVMQAGNRRVNLNITDAKYAHLQLCRDLAMMYAHFGIGNRVKIFGKQGPFLTKALESFKQGKLAFPIKAATASVNREIEKQNDILLSGVMKQHYAAIAQILQTLPQAPPHMQEYLVGVVKASDYLMRDLLREFGKYEIARYLPEPKLIKEMSNAANGGAAQEAAGGNVSGQPVREAPASLQGARPQLVDGSGGGASQAVS